MCRDTSLSNWQYLKDLKLIIIILFYFFFFGGGGGGRFRDADFEPNHNSRSEAMREKIYN